MEEQKKKLSRRDFLRLSAVVTASGVIAACAPPTPEATEEPPAEATLVPPAEKEPVTIVYWSHAYEFLVNLIDDHLIPGYKEVAPHVTVEHPVAVPSYDLDQKLVTAMAGGTGPDFFSLGDWNVGRYVSLDSIGPVDPVAFGVDTQNELIDLYMPRSLNGYLIDGKVYGIPMEFNSFVTYYRVPDFEEVGLDPQNPPVVFEDHIEAAQKLAKHDADGNLTRAGLDFMYANPSWYFFHFQPILNQLGATLLNEEETECAIDTPEGIEALDFWRKCYWDWHIDEAAFPPESVWGFGAGTSSMIHCGIWFPPGLKGQYPDFQYGTDYLAGPYPKFSDAKEKVTILYGWAWMVNANSEHPREAWEFVDYLTLQQESWLSEVGYIQPRLGWFDSPTAKALPYLDLFLEEMKYGRYMPRTAHWHEVAEAQMAALERLSSENENPEVVAADLCDKINEALKT